MSSRRIVENAGFEVRVVAPGARGYPQRLVERLGDRAPPRLYIAGELGRQRAVAVVGTRAATPDRERAATDLAEALVAAGHTVVSGGALGVDAAAHRGALAGGLGARRGVGTTIAVLGCGLDRPYPPRNRALFAAIVAEGGALASPFAPGEPPRRGHCPARNLLIAAWAEAVVVVEAGFRSGALNTARHARKLGVPVLAYPGSPGSLALLRGGSPARRVASPGAVLRAIEGQGPPIPRQPPDHPDDRAVLSALTQLQDRQAQIGGVAVAEVARMAQVRLSRAAAALIRLQLDSRVQPAAGGGYLTTVDA